ncbi:MAG TPA: hypothetical protein VHC86_12210 [Opitutaceae bacterium]|nr:hypothetical protein [Opitutaceae bacterium]
MLEGYLTQVATESALAEEPAAVSARLRSVFSAGAGRRATVLGLLIGKVLEDRERWPTDAIVYASRFGETRALSAFLDTFPHPSPTLFQTSVHPSAVQQVMIERRRPVPEYFPLAGGPDLAARALVTAFACPAEAVILCGGDERGSWMAEAGVASDQGFAFAALLRRSAGPAPLARLRLTPAEGPAAGGLAFPDWFALLHGRRAFGGPVSPDWRLELEWLRPAGP